MYLATHDALTGLPNRNLLQDRLGQALVQARRSQGQAAVMFIDLDHFKTVNDSLGHEMGDTLLKEVAARLVAGLRSGDTVARQGGDEFIALLSDIGHAQDAGEVGQKLLVDLAVPYMIKGQELHVSASIGISVFPDDGDDVDTLMKHSDIAMYHAKENGRNNCQFFMASLNEAAAARLAMETDFRHALERHELSLNYQPVIDLASGRMAGMEVLLRWQHPQRGAVSPVQFIPLAEDSGLIVPMGEWVLRTACEQLKTWLDQGYDVPRMAINLSIRQFREKDLVPTIARVLRETGIEATRVGLEITESLLIDRVSEVTAALEQLSGMGLEISLDDFGTGYSSLSHLKRLPIDKLKIDRSFVRELATDPDDAAIVTAIVAMATA